LVLSPCAKQDDKVVPGNYFSADKLEDENKILACLCFFNLRLTLLNVFMKVNCLLKALLGKFIKKKSRQEAKFESFCEEKSIIV